MKFILFRCVVFSLACFTVCLAQAQTLKQTQIIDSISNAYKKLQEYHMHVQTDVSVSKKQVASQVYDIYKRNTDFYLKSNQMEILFDSSLVLMILKDQKQMIVRPVSDKDIQVAKEFETPAIDSIVRKNVFDNFSETENAYVFTTYNDKGQIVKTIYSYSKKDFLLANVQISYADTDDNKDQRSVIQYTYSSIPASAASTCFNKEKYLIQTKSGYTATAAYSNYYINVIDTYEK